MKIPHLTTSRSGAASLGRIAGIHLLVAIGNVGTLLAQVGFSVDSVGFSHAASAELIGTPLTGLETEESIGGVGFVPLEDLVGTSSFGGATALDFFSDLINDRFTLQETRAGASARNEVNFAGPTGPDDPEFSLRLATVTTLSGLRRPNIDFGPNYTVEAVATAATVLHFTLAEQATVNLDLRANRFDFLLGNLPFQPIADLPGADAIALAGNTAISLTRTGGAALGALAFAETGTTAPRGDLAGASQNLLLEAGQYELRVETTSTGSWVLPAVNTEFSYTFTGEALLTFNAKLFVWEGAADVGFRTEANWSAGTIPGPSDTVQLTSPGQIKTIEFAADDLVTNERLLVGSDSNTNIDLNGSLWRIDGAANPEPTGQFRLAGGTLTLGDGTLEVFGRAEVANDAGFDNLLQIGEGARLIVRGDDFVVGVGGGTRDTQLQIDGSGSRLEARDVILGAANGEVTALVSGGGALLAERALTIGSGGAARVGITGAGAATGSFVQVTEGGQLTIGGAATGLLTISNGASAILNDVDVTIGANGEFSLSGVNSRINGGRFTVRDGGQLTIADAPTIVESVTVDDGSVFVRQNAIVNLGPVAVTNGGLVTVESGATAIASTLDIAPTASTATTGAVQVLDGSHLRVTQLTRVGGSFGGTGLLNVDGRNGESVSRFTSEADVIVGGALGTGQLLIEDGASAAISGTLSSFAPAPTGESPTRSEILVRGADSELTAGHVAVTSHTTLEVGVGASLVATDTFTVGGESSVTISGDAAFGEMTIFEGSTVFLAGPDARATASSVIMGGSIFGVEEGAVLVAPSFTLNAGFLSGHGRIVGNLTHNGGFILPGSSPGILTIEGDYIQTGGRIVLEIGGTGAGTQFDQLVVTGAFDLAGGEIEFSFIDGFAPEAGQTFEFFDVGGAFTGASEFIVTGLEDGWEFATAFDPETGTFGLTSLNDGISAIPEPGIYLLLTIAAAMFLIHYRAPAPPTRTPKH